MRPRRRSRRRFSPRSAPKDIGETELAGEKITGILTTAPGTQDSIGGVKVTSDSGWFAARPSGTEDVYKLYAESFKGAEHLKKIQDEAQGIIQRAFDKVKK